MGFRRLQAEEYNPEIANYAEQMRSISDLTAEESLRSENRRAQGQADRLAVEERGFDALIGGVKEGVTGGADRYQANKRMQREEARLDKQDARADRGEDRSDKQVGMQEEEFGLRKPEMQAQAGTAEQRARLGIEGQEAGIAGAKAGTRQATVQADTMEREESWKNASASGKPEAREGETNRDYVQRMDLEGNKANRDLAIAQLDEAKATRGGRVALQNAQIGAANASTEAQTIANTAAREDTEIRKLTAMASAPKPGDLEKLSPYLAKEVNEGRIKPEKAALVIAGIKNAEAQKALQQQLVNNANPEYQDRITRTFAARDKADNYLSAIAEMETALAQNRSNNMFTDDGARVRFATMLDGVGMATDAEKIRNGSDLGSIGDKDNPFGLTGRMETLLAKVKVSARAQMDVLSAEIKADPKVAELSQRISQLNASASPGQGKQQLFGSPNQGPQIGAGQNGNRPGMPQPLPGRNARKREAPASVGGPRK